jgi:hypothetical protein
VSNQSILDTVKELVNLPSDDTSFDRVIKIHINSVFSTLTQLGVGPTTGFVITDSTTTWDAFTGDSDLLESVISYMYLKVRLLFDPPQNSFSITSFEKQAEEYEWRLNVVREGETWVPPVPPPSTTTEWC